jgi:superfamily II DNA or RNA helicase
MERMVIGAMQVKGSDPDEKKEEIFNGFRRGQIKKLVTKPKIAAFGMNWQHTNYMTVFPTHSYEQYYQMLRRCWRFGQEKPVTAEIITSDTQANMLGNVRRKAVACEVMFTELVNEMNNALNVNRMTKFEKKEIIPSWL